MLKMHFRLRSTVTGRSCASGVTTQRGDPVMAIVFPLKSSVMCFCLYGV